MGVASRVGAAWAALRGRASEGAIVAGVDGLNDLTGSTFVNLLGGGVRGVSIGEADSMSIPAFLRGLEVMCGIFAAAPLVYYRKLDDGGKEPATDQPLYDMFCERPNDWQSPFLFKELLLGDLLLRRKFASYIHRDTLYRPIALTRLPYGIQPQYHWSKQDGMTLFYDAQLPDGSFERLTSNDLWFVPGFSRDGFIGIDRLKLLEDTIHGATETMRFAARFWGNNAQPSTILTTKAKVKQEEKDRIKSDWRTRFGGSNNAGGVAVLDQEMDAKFLAHDNKASQYVEVRTFTVVEIARILGVPPHIVFELSKATFSNIEQQSLELILYHMMPHFERVASAATHQFAEKGYFFAFNPDAYLMGDIISRYTAYGIAIDKGIFNPNEVRAKENENKRPGGEEYRVGSGSTIEGAPPPKPTDNRAPAPAPQEEEE